MASYKPQMPMANSQPAGVSDGITVPVDGSTAWTHVACDQPWKIPDPVMGFYINMPENAACKWSSDHGRLKKHTIWHPLPMRQLRHWDDARLRSRAAYFRKKFSQDMGGLRKPTRFEDLYDYFDSRDLYFQGAWNAWNLICLLVDENIFLGPAVLDAQRKETDDWVSSWARMPGNQEKLLAWDRTIDILGILSQDDWHPNVGGVALLYDKQLGMLRVSLVNYYRILSEPSHAGSPPLHSGHRSQNGDPVTTWLNKTQSPPERITPPLNTIQEEAGKGTQRACTDPKRPVIVNGTMGMAPRLRKSADNSPLANKGKGNSSDTATMRAVSDPTSTTNGSPDSDETWKSGAFFKPKKPSKGQDGTKAHQATKSVPSITTEPFPKLADSLPYICNDITQAEPVEKNGSAGEDPFKDQTPRGVNAAQRSQTVAPIQHATGANHNQAYTEAQAFPAVILTQTMPLPSVTQVNTLHGTNTFAAPSNPSQPWQNSSIGGQTSASAQSSQVYGYSQTPQASVDMHGPQQAQSQEAIQPQGVMQHQGYTQNQGYFQSQGYVQSQGGFQSQSSFQNQSGMQSQGGNPYLAQSGQATASQFAPQPVNSQMTLPRHLASMPLPSYVSNSLIQSQENPAQNRRYSNRNSPPRNGWQTKIRDDPIHGAMYVHNSHRNNSIARGTGYQGAQHNQQQADAQDHGLQIACVNYARPYGTSYAPCACKKCHDATRSLFLREFNVTVAGNKTSRVTLARFFKQWGDVEEVKFHARDHPKKRMYAIVRFRLHTQALEAMAYLKGPGQIQIPGLGNNIFLGYPNFSMYFNRTANEKALREQTLHAPRSDARASVPAAVFTSQPQQGAHGEMNPHNNGRVVNQNEHRMVPRPGFGYSGGAPVTHGLPPRPPVQVYGPPPTGQTSMGPASQPSAYMPSYRPTPSSLQREIAHLDQGGQHHHRPYLSSEDAGSEPMDLASTSSSCATSVVQTRYRVNVPTTPPMQRDVSSSPSAGPSQGAKTIRPQARDTAPKQAVSATSSTSSSSGQPRVILRLADSSSSSSSGQPRVILRLADSSSTVSETSPMPVEVTQKDSSIPENVNPADVALPPTPEDLPTTTQPSSTLSGKESLQKMPVSSVTTQSKQTSTSRNVGSAAGEQDRARSYDGDDEIESRLSSSGVPRRLSFFDQALSAIRGKFTRKAEVVPEDTNKHADKKMKFKENAAEKATVEQVEAPAVNSLVGEAESQRPSSSGSQRSSQESAQREAQLRLKKKASKKRRKERERAEKARNAEAAQLSSEMATNNEKAKPEEYKEKIVNLLDDANKSENAPSTNLAKEPQPAVGDIRKAYRADAGGSLKMQKNRPPALSQNTFNPPEKSAPSHLSKLQKFQDTLDATSTTARNLPGPPTISPAAHVFTNQKFEIDKMKPKEQPVDQAVEQPKAGASQPKPTSQIRLGSLPPGFDPYPRPPAPRPSSRDDVFSPKKDEKKAEELWMHTESVRKTATENQRVVTPSPSPRKAAIATPSPAKSSLNPSARPFVAPAPQSQAPPATSLAAGTKHARQASHLSTHSSAPSTSSKVSSGRRYFTPLEQTPKKAPTPPSPKKAKQPPRHGPNSSTQAPKPINNNNPKKVGARPPQRQEQIKKKPAEPVAPPKPAAPKLNVDNFPELPAAKKPQVEAHAPKLTFPTNSWNKSKEPATTRTSSNEQDKTLASKAEE